MICLIVKLSYPVLKEQPSLFGGNGEREPRVPISNTTVKPFSADGTWTAGSWESRTSPSTDEPVTLNRSRFFCCVA